MTSVWDHYWESSSVEDALVRVAAEERSRRFRGIVTSLYARLGTLEGRRSVELGAGAGTTSIALARLGVGITLIDRSEPALSAAQAAATAAGVEASAVNADLFEPPEEHLGRYDLATSFGVAEHFAGENRKRVFAAHLRWLRPGGIAVVAVPNSLCPTYRVWKWWLERTGEWPFGFEQPFFPPRLRRLAHAVGGVDVEMVGSSAVGDLFRFATPVVAHRLTHGRLRLPNVEIASPFDRVFGYALSVIYASPPTDSTP